MLAGEPDNDTSGANEQQQPAAMRTLKYSQTMQRSNINFNAGDVLEIQ